MKKQKDIVSERNRKSLRNPTLQEVDEYFKQEKEINRQINVVKNKLLSLDSIIDDNERLEKRKQIIEKNPNIVKYIPFVEVDFKIYFNNCLIDLKSRYKTQINQEVDENTIYENVLDEYNSKTKYLKEYIAEYIELRNQAKPYRKLIELGDTIGILSIEKKAYEILFTEIGEPDDIESVDIPPTIYKHFPKSIKTILEKNKQENTNLTKGKENNLGEIEDKKQKSDYSWRGITIEIIDDETLTIKKGREKAIRVNCSEIGLMNKTKSRPNLQWTILIQLAEHQGLIPYRKWSFKDRKYIEKQISELRKRLKSFFKIDSDPIPFKKKFGYQTEFILRDKRS